MAEQEENPIKGQQIKHTHTLTWQAIKNDMRTVLFLFTTTTTAAASISKLEFE